MKPTNLPLPSEIERVETVSGVRYALPRRGLGRVHLIGLIPLVGSLLAGYWIVAVFLKNFGWPIRGGIEDMFVAAIAIPFLYIDFSVIRFGMLILLGRCDIELRHDTLRATQRALFFWRARRWKLEKLDHLQIVGFVPSDSQESKGPTMQKLDALVAVQPDGKRMMVAPGYPRSWLLPLAHDIAERSGRDSSFVHVTAGQTTSMADRMRGEIEADLALAEADASATTEAQIARARADSFDPPKDTKIELQRLPDGLTLKAPPAGLRAGTHGMFGFGLAWCAFMTLVTLLILFVKSEPVRGDRQMPLAGTIAFVGGFWIVGIGIIASGVNMARRSAAIAVAGGQMMAIQTGLFGTKKNQWHLAELETVKVGPSNMKVNDQPVMQLQIKPLEGETFGLLTGRDLADLHWMANLLNQQVAIHRLEQASNVAIEQPEIDEADVDQADEERFSS